MNAQLGTRMQEGEEEYINVLKSKVDYCKAAHKRDPDNDSALVEWGCTLTYLAMAEGDIKRKKEMLRESRDKLNKAMKINPDAMTSNGDYAIFQLGSVFYINFLYEEDDKQAEQYFSKCKLCFSKGAKRYPHIGVIATPENAYEERANVQETAKRMQGKTQEEQLQEYVQMVQEQHAALELKLKKSPEDPNLLKSYARSLLELSQYDVGNSTQLVEQAITRLRNCLEIERSTEALTILSLALQSRAVVQGDAGKSRMDFVEARELFTEAITLEYDTVVQRQMLLQLRDMYNVPLLWKERFAEHADKMVIDPLPDWLADLPDNALSTSMPEASALNTRELVSNLKRGSRQGSQQSRRVKNEQAKSVAPAPKVANPEEVEEVKETEEQVPSSAEAKKKKKKRKKTKSKSAPTSEDTEPQARPAPETSFPSATSLSLVGVCAAAALLTAYLVIRSRRTAAS
ncbi:hypothetical protein GUITHDRAFT_134813 [Guillardia theta CCMP2712]|uniref:Uncharacterized protein n=1 Tax=Guillardia theta (strain CCMP2712) TaxID=905079 RepID=L1JTE7_GUITC|nr:hypothetical protein GUITHDRAFT_134813 [Guillardia theta CCMP2712]EKX51343.1 hypothetical protein GUITHDRAFT_134813 [Guillardia theta CCMP2712]|mmetsp:Transcript_42440/g.133691  ORF Transcript_42440/g.133691 Transcript_42440/m.133691 type:complete len:458 (-) Transcript_42440:48-1421(-)|eukprot:XP_005838323.1 hypothetical protein GUITHDRAFT_134813 [Guillardia theta CCMP2712]